MSNNTSGKIGCIPALLEITRTSISGWWNILTKLLLPAVFVLAGALIYSEIDTAFADTPSSIGEMLTKIGEDIMSNPVLFIAFLIVLTLWVFTQVFRKDPVLTELKKMNDKLDTLLSKMDAKLDILIQRGEQNDDKNSK